MSVALLIKRQFVNDNLANQVIVSYICPELIIYKSKQFNKNIFQYENFNNNG